jgi:hypothetical protein
MKAKMPMAFREGNQVAIDIVNDHESSRLQ